MMEPKPQTSQTVISFKEMTNAHRYIFLAIAAAILIIIMNLPPPRGMPREGLTLLAITASIVFLWITEAIPLAISALLLPILMATFGVATFSNIITQTTGSTVFVFLMGILTLSVACRKSGLSKRLASYFMLYTSKNANMVLLGIMFVCFFISMWITDMAAVAIVIPVAIGVLRAFGAEPMKSKYAKSLMLGVSWGSIFGGMTTPAGVGSNIIAMHLLKNTAHMSVSFTQWMTLGLPIGIIGNIAGFFVLKALFKSEIKEIPIDKSTIKEELAKEKITRAQKWVLLVFALVIVAFVTSGSTKLDINYIALCIIPLLLAPGTGVFKDWKDLETSINWGAIFLAVAGVSLGTVAAKVGMTKWVAATFLAPIIHLPGLGQLFAVAGLTNVIGLFLSSMTITASVSVPIVISYAQSVGAPVWAMVAAATMASSSVIVLVTQTPSLILSYAEGYYSIKDCAIAGIIMTVVSAIIIAAVIFIAGMPTGLPA